LGGLRPQKEKVISLLSFKKESFFFGRQCLYGALGHNAWQAYFTHDETASKKTNASELRPLEKLAVW